MTTYLLSERIFRIYSGNDPSDDSGIELEDIKHMVIDQINLLLKTETISLNRQLGDEAPTGLMLATYHDVAVTAHATVLSRALLPAVPISLPLNMGVWYVAADDDTTAIHDQFIPLQAGQYSLIKDFSPLVVSGSILGNKTYEVSGAYLVFPTDISSTVPKVVIKLVISDIANLGDYDLLPIPADYVPQVINAVLQLLGVVPEVTDVANDANPQK